MPSGGLRTRRILSALPSKRVAGCPWGMGSMSACRMTSATSLAPPHVHVNRAMDVESLALYSARTVVAACLLCFSCEKALDVFLLAFIWMSAVKKDEEKECAEGAAKEMGADASLCVFQHGAPACQTENLFQNVCRDKMGCYIDPVWLDSWVNHAVRFLFLSSWQQCIDAR